MNNAFCEDVSRAFGEHGERSERGTKQEAKSSLDRFRALKGSYKPADGPRAPSPPVVLPELCYTAETWSDMCLIEGTPNNPLEGRHLKYRRDQCLVFANNALTSLRRDIGGLLI
ncbi:unnamed protein product [Strongylus vulgaris]|uniref:Uncharacterized protein n=1 Tax=Strongylus vulgaris TaxID=40348 RepID=A0A3P7LLH2_STRVU|nr:unnamed protein product [Strongylus vulgaris]